ncbi:hypothetical protein [Rhodothermus marinus]|uniref:hypothetical protein n=1 Tax=Rhodothermus marinus TaxID=29549 RepID=UPI0012BA46F8|nr:hypothetical protein [Rhodothermus marinus]BBM68598.1 hypothetical protein RmaAA213_04440 [Rhodothermus marinus]
MRRYALMTAVSSIFCLMLSGYRVPPSDQLPSRNPEKHAIETLLSIREALMHRMREHNVPESKLWAAYQQNDTEQLAQLLGISSEELETLSHRLQSATQILLQKYPELQQANDYTQALKVLNLNVSMTTTASPRCDYGAYTGCLIYSAVTSGGNPLFYFLGSYICLCGFCRGSYVDDICIRA